MRITIHSLLLLLLQALTGPALAAPCEDAAEVATTNTVEMAGHHTVPVTDGKVQSYCDEASSGGCDSHSSECGPGCNCCPGHCAGALPAGDPRTLALIRSVPTSFYSPLNSTPEPETALRPPIGR